jgi:hypothetical protein
MDFNVYIGIDYEALHGESASLANQSKELTHLMLQKQ